MNYYISMAISQIEYFFVIPVQITLAFMFYKCFSNVFRSKKIIIFSFYSYKYIVIIENFCTHTFTYAYRVTNSSYFKANQKCELFVLLILNLL